MTDYTTYMPILRRLRVKVPKRTKKRNVVAIGQWTVAAMTIQRAFRRKMTSANDTCPILMTEIKWPFTAFKMSPGRYLRLSLEGYAGMLESGVKMINPLTRQEMTDQQMYQARDTVHLYLEKVIHDKYGTLPIMYYPRMYTSFQSNNVPDLMPIVEDTAASARAYESKLEQDRKSAEQEYKNHLARTRYEERDSERDYAAERAEFLRERAEIIRNHNEAIRIRNARDFQFERAEITRNRNAAFRNEPRNEPRYIRFDIDNTRENIATIVAMMAESLAQ